MGLEARLLKQAGYNVTVGINMYPILKNWVSALGRMTIFRYSITTLRRSWKNGGGGARSKLSKYGFLERGQELLWRIAQRRNKFLAKKRSKKFFKRNRFDLNHIFLPWSDFGGTRLGVAHYNRVPAILSVRNAFRPTTWSGRAAEHYREVFQAVRGIYAISQSALDHFMVHFR